MKRGEIGWNYVIALVIGLIILLFIIVIAANSRDRIMQVIFDLKALLGLG